jgi:hypothetical protein
LHHKYVCSDVIINDDQQDATILDLYVSSLLYMFRAIPSRSSSGAHNCTYSFGCCQPILLLAGIMDEMELRSISSMIPAILVDNTRSCKYSYIILMMGEGNAQNMYSRV